jgi:hypothetical protein
MASIKFPSGPSLNQVFSSSGRNWKWNGARWVNHTVPLVIEQTQIASLSTDLAAKASAAEVATKAPTSSPAFTGTVTAADLTLSGTTRVKPIIETVNILTTGFASGFNYDVKAGAVKLILAPSTGNGYVNFRGDSSTTLGSMMAVGESLSVSLMIANTTAYGVTSVTIDGSSPNTFRWLGGTAPTKSSSAIDAYSFTIIKSGSATYEVFASMSKFA